MPAAPPTLRDLANVILRRLGASPLPEAAAAAAMVNVDRENILGIERLVAALRGRFQRGALADDAHAGGSPRGWRAPRGLEMAAVADADPAAACAWARDPAPELPRVRRRTRANRRGGCVAVLRDISASMFGAARRETSIPWR